MSIKDTISKILHMLYKQENKPMEPNQNPKEVKVIIDAGHGGADWGLNTVKDGKRTPNKGYNGVLEKDINLEVATRLGWLCGRHSVGYLLTRWGDRPISLAERCKRANMTKAKLFISIHCNYALNHRIRGIETFHYKNSLNGRILASRCQTKLVSLEYSPGRYVKGNNFYVLKKSAMAAVLVELGYLSNPKDATYLNNENNQMIVAAKLWEFIKGVLA